MSTHRVRSLLGPIHAAGRGLLLVAGRTSATPGPAKAAADYAAMEAVIEDKISSGSLALSTIDAVLVSVDGETKVAHYRNGSKPDDALHVWSVTKSVVSALIGIAIDEKIISGLNATLLELLASVPEISDRGGEVDHAAPADVHDGRLPIRRARQNRQSLRTANRSDTEHPDRRLGHAARRSFWLFEYMAHTWCPPCYARHWSEPMVTIRAAFWSMRARNSSIRWKSTPVVPRRSASC